MRTYFAEQLIPADFPTNRTVTGVDGNGQPLTATGRILEATRIDGTNTMRVTVQERRRIDADTHVEHTVYAQLGPDVADRRFRIRWTEVSNHEATVDAAALATLVGLHDVGELADALAQIGGDLADLDHGDIADELASLDDDGYQGVTRDDVEIAYPDAV